MTKEMSDEETVRCLQEALMARDVHFEVIRDHSDGPDEGKLMIVARGDTENNSTMILTRITRAQAQALVRDLVEFIAEAKTAKDPN
jgi:hypothetical protein